MAIPLVVVKYLDLKRRKYEIFTDSIFYTEGFLTKNYSFLPMEKVTDTENTQSFFSKIFGLHDVVVSSE
jgi:membrane protein YdbS with pleckstrin-like domain